MIDLLERQKRLTVNQWKLICTANLADLLDFFDLFLIGHVTAALTKEWSLTYWQGGVILMASGIGAPPGAFVWGWLGDRIGRRTVFIWSAVTISLATGVLVFTPRPDALVPGWLYLAIFRVFVGLGNAGIYAIDLLWHRSLGGPTSENGCLCRGDGSPRTGQPQEVAHVACDLSA